jgi:hypothetical protein
MKKRTDSYVFTADPLSTVDMAQIEIVRKTVKVANSRALQEYKYAVKSYQRGYSSQMPKKPKLYRVSLKARLGRNNPNADIYKSKITRWGFGDYQSIKLEHAQRIDIYVHAR